jgi:Immunity protein 27
MRGWITTYRDPTDGSIWIMDYPHGEAEGGGPARLRR